MLTLLEEHQFYSKKSKCTFGKEEVEYHKLIISHEGVKVDLNKIKAKKEWTKPITISKLRGFIGLTGYYQRFIKNYSHITTPLTNLLKKNSFQWNEEAGRCFEELKEVMSNASVLATPNFSNHLSLSVMLPSLV